MTRRKIIQAIAAGGLIVPASAIPPAPLNLTENTDANHYNGLKKRIREASIALSPETKQNREFLHRHPEGSHEEAETVQFIARKLAEYGLTDIKTGDIGVGVLGVIRGDNPERGPVVALRADIDALPILEQNQHATYRSEKEGFMHACGHDFHTAALLSAAKILHDLRQNWIGTVKILFQRGEERAHPELNKPGALLALENGLLGEPRPAIILGQHVSPEIPFGKVGFFPVGQVGSMAAVDTLFIEVMGGAGGHGARPFSSIDPVPAAAAIIAGLQTIVSRRTDPNSPCVLSIGEVKTEGGTANVLAKKVNMAGTLRTFDPVFRQRIIAEIKAMARQTGLAYGAKAGVKTLENTIPLTNSPALNSKARSAAVSFLGEENVMESPRRTGGEDFSYFQLADGLQTCFWRIGVGDPASNQFCSDLHTDTFDIHPEAMRLSPGLLAWAAVSVAGR